MADFYDYQYNGVKVQSTRRRTSSRDDKKYMRTVRYQGDERLIHYGDPNMPMRRDNPEARSNFLSRHSCDTKRDPFAPGFWACYDWSNVDENDADMNGVDDFQAMKSEGDGRHPASHYLVVEDPERPTTWHLRVRDMQGDPDPRLMGAAWAALHDGYRGNRYEGPNKQEAITKLRRLYNQMDRQPPGERDNSSFVLVDEYIALQAGEPYRLLPFGVIYKNGKKREITPELARKFKLPPFKPPIKLGSHDDNSPAGGHILRLEVREDGLYAVPEFNLNGTTAINEGHYRYHSPEVIFDGEMEDAETGELIDGPFIVGDALLHTPHLGEAAALYEYQIVNGGNAMSEMTQVPTSWFEKFTAFMFGKLDEPNDAPEPPQPKPEPKQTPPAPQVEVDKFAALEQERDDFKAQLAEREKEIETLKAQQAKADRVSHFATEFKETVLAENTDLHELLTAVPNEVADKLLVHFKALAEQARVGDVTKQVGGSGNPEGEGEQTPDEFIQSIMKEDKALTYIKAFEIAKERRPDMFTVQKNGGNK